MIKRDKRAEMDNVIRVSGDKVRNTGTTPFFQSVILRAQPRIYNKYSCIKIRYTANTWNVVFNLLCQFWHLGLACESITLCKEKLRMGDNAIIDTPYEATLKKIGAIMFSDDEEYSNQMNKLWERRDE